MFDYRWFAKNGRVEHMGVASASGHMSVVGQVRREVKAAVFGLEKRMADGGWLRLVGMRVDWEFPEGFGGVA
jgi:hypothetical protein